MHIKISIKKTTNIHRQDSPRHPAWYLFDAFGGPWGASGREGRKDVGGRSFLEGPWSALGTHAVPFGRVLVPFCTSLGKHRENVVVIVWLWF